MCIMRFAAKVTLPVIKGFDLDTVLFTPGLSCKTAGVTGMDDTISSSELPSSELYAS